MFLKLARGTLLHIHLHRLRMGLQAVDQTPKECVVGRLEDEYTQTFTYLQLRRVTMWNLDSHGRTTAKVYQAVLGAINVADICGMPWEGGWMLEMG